MALRPLTAYQVEAYRPRIPVIVGLIVVAALYVGSMFLNWAGVVAVDGSYLIVTGLRQANWMLAVAVVVLVLAIRLSRAPPTGFLHFGFVALDFLVTLGLYIEYIDNLGRAEADTMKPYLGPGFYIALGATALLIVSTVFGWRESDAWTGSSEQSAPPL
jgi:uncharacterized membrane protein